jgi:hypothetical protein
MDIPSFLQSSMAKVKKKAHSKNKKSSKAVRLTVSKTIKKTQPRK